MTQMEALKELCGGFITKDVLEDVIRINRLEPILVRCGGCRFTAPAQDVPHLLKIIGNSRDYVRDVSFPANAYISPVVVPVAPKRDMACTVQTESTYRKAGYCGGDDEFRGDHDSGL